MALDHSPMESAPPSVRSSDTLALLVVGALTIDRFPGGRTAPGGSVLHASRAASRAGFTTGTVTCAGGEPEARAALLELATIGRLDVSMGAATASFRHAEVDDERRLILEVPATPLALAPRPVVPGAVLYAPVAGELGSDLGGQVYDGPRTGAILQGWLRTLEAGKVVRPLPLAALDPAVVERMARMSLLVASRDDLAASGTTVEDQLAALRRAVGPWPVLAVTDGIAGANLDIRGERIAIPVPRVVENVSTVGAGDAYAALLLLRLAGWGGPVDAATLAASDVADILDERATRAGPDGPVA